MDTSVAKTLIICGAIVFSLLLVVLGVVAVFAADVVGLSLAIGGVLTGIGTLVASVMKTRINSGGST